MNANNAYNDGNIVMRLEHLDIWCLRRAITGLFWLLDPIKV